MRQDPVHPSSNHTSKHGYYVTSAVKLQNKAIHFPFENTVISVNRIVRSDKVDSRHIFQTA